MRARLFILKSSLSLSLSIIYLSLYLKSFFLSCHLAFFLSSSLGYEVANLPRAKKAYEWLRRSAEGPRAPACAAVFPRAPACARVRQRAPASQACTKVSEPVTADLPAARARR